MVVPVSAVGPELLLVLAEHVVSDLIVMHEDTAIDLDTWPAAKKLVEALRCAERSNPDSENYNIRYFCVLPKGHMQVPGDKHGSTVKATMKGSALTIVSTTWPTKDGAGQQVGSTTKIET